MQRSAKSGLQAVEPATRLDGGRGAGGLAPEHQILYVSPKATRNPARANPKRPLPPHGPPLTHRPIRRDHRQYMLQS
jgi:hypothetical protein